MCLAKETVIGPGATKTAIEECWMCQNLPITLDMAKAEENSCEMCNEHMRQEQVIKNRM